MRAADFVLRLRAIEAVLLGFGRQTL